MLEKMCFEFPHHLLVFKLLVKHIYHYTMQLKVNKDGYFLATLVYIGKKSKVREIPILFVLYLDNLGQFHQHSGTKCNVPVHKRCCTGSTREQYQCQLM
jgi:hypothetical protein